MKLKFENAYNTLSVQFAILTTMFWIVFFCSGNKDIIVYACDCSSEILERTKEFVGASDIASVKNRFFPFYCDFCTTGFPDWLACNYCRGSQPQKQHDCFSGFKLYPFLLMLCI